ncbi:protein mono-ADP-ribosyltransferase PARP12 isoform X1 [Takifugu flavidus]|uniref:protein mono-ADP-ribosyltransferase PARP12 isoform X1 n=1 Tax=Takifugu flavidus TaxID=433684 RepID=UPI002544B357|nr:protein mono-ADP-ribosyltransferase PARP12 isoform X1 [Takifugu flavidus]
MNPSISKFITKTLCDHQGCLDLESLNGIINKQFTVAESILQTVLFDHGKIAIRAGKQKAAGIKGLSPDSLIVAKTSLRLCQVKNGQCSQCEHLHVCKFLVLGKCKFGNACKTSHSVFSGNNLKVLKNHDLQDLTEKQLFQLLLQNDPWLLPEVCSHYNRGNGLHGSCKNNASCLKLHICQHFLEGDCRFGSTCKRAHSFKCNEKPLFQFFSQENIENRSQLYRNRFIIAAQELQGDAACSAAPQAVESPPRLSLDSKPMSDIDKNEICLFFIRRKCRFKECARVHWHLPYRWQVLEDGVTWNDLPNMEEIEKAYCDPRCDKSTMDQPLPAMTLFERLSLKRPQPPASPVVDFMSMTYKSSPVRRLSTVSSVSKPPTFILTTEWLWYWKCGSEQWLEFGKSNAEEQVEEQASTTSPMLESLYLADRDGVVPFCVGNQQYILNFKGDLGTQMYQQNLKYKTKREVRRRPRFVSAEEVNKKLQSQSSQSQGSSTAESFPSHWDKIDPPDYDYKLILLSKSKEYDMIVTLFQRTMPKSKINTIHRIQNPFLWKVFQWQKEEMMKKNDGKAVNQLYLFHGTDESLSEAICEQNFDWRMCGAHGTAYGKGSYFARDASYSDMYSRRSKSQSKIMFVALVLVGDYTKGNSSYVKPPPKGNGKTFYNSCVNSESNPSIYIIFDKQQVYPEYLINYS